MRRFSFIINVSFFSFFPFDTFFSIYYYIAGIKSKINVRTIHFRVKFERRLRGVWRRIEMRFFLLLLFWWSLWTKFTIPRKPGNIYNIVSGAIEQYKHTSQHSSTPGTFAQRKRMKYYCVIFWHVLFFFLSPETNFILFSRSFDVQQTLIQWNILSVFIV